ncbi:MAG: TonB-dependent receptor [Caulobacteraceae bacterium]|nr:TonB-dependent receptor [Caulobacteraceae bacterium]
MTIGTISMRAALFAGVSLLAASAAQAQDAPAPAADGVAEVEELVVVGSQIRGAQVNEALPVTVLSTNDIEATGATGGDELLRSIPQMGDVAFNESRDAGGINDARGDVASINLRGLGTGNTLVLLNGRRMVLHPGTQAENLIPVTSVNANAIPVLGIARVEVLRDGAAAIYGTDAVAGVVNNVLKTRFDGLTVEAEGGFMEDTDFQEYELNFEAGHTFNDGKSNISLFGSHLNRDRLRANERPFSRSSDLRPLVEGTAFAGDTEFDNRSGDSPWGEFIRLNPNTFGAAGTTTYVGSTQLAASSGSFHAQPATNDGCIVTFGDVCFDNSTAAATATGADSNLRYNVNEVRNLLGEVDRTNLFAYFNHEFDNGLEAFAEAGVYYADYSSQRDQETALASQRLIIPANAYYHPLGSGAGRLANLHSGSATGAFPAAGVPVELQDYRVVDAGPLTYNVEDLVTRYLAGLRGEFAGFDWESAFLYSRAKTDDTMQVASMTLFQQALSGTTADAYNPFNGADPNNPEEGDSSPNPQSVIDSFIVDVSRISKTSLRLWDFKVSKRDLFTLPAGDVGVAAGVELRRETFSEDRDPRLDGTIVFTALDGSSNGSDVMGASPTPDTKGARNVQSGWLEFAVPVVSPDMNIPLVRSVDLQLAARYEHYTSFGDVLKPKVAVGWRPAEWLLVRGSWSEGFRAPNLPQLYERGIQRSNTRSDWAKCEIARRNGDIANFDECTIRQGVVSNRSGSLELEPEESENFTAGVVFEPPLPSGYGRLTITGDYWQVKQKGLIGLFGDSSAITLDYFLRLSGSSNPNVQRAAPTPDQIADAQAAGMQPAGDIIQVIDNYSNLAPREVEGVDIAVYYSIDDTAWGDFDVKFNAARLLTFYQDPDADKQALIDAQKAGTIDPSIFIPGAESLIQENGLPKWRATGTVTWRNGPFGAGYFASYTGPVNDTSATLADGTPWRVKSHLTHNLYGQYTFEGGRWLDETRVRIGVRNLTDNNPPLADGTFGYLGELHSARGRFWYAQIRKRF